MRNKLLQSLNQNKLKERSAFHIILGNEYENYENALTVLEKEPLLERRLKLCQKFAKKSLKIQNLKTGSVLQILDLPIQWILEIAKLLTNWSRFKPELLDLKIHPFHFWLSFWTICNHLKISSWGNVNCGL